MRFLSSKIFVVFASIIGSIAGLIAILGFIARSGTITIYDFIEKNENVRVIIGNIAYYISIGITIVLLVCFIYNVLCKAGVRGTPINFWLFLRKFKPSMLSSFAFSVHKFQHELTLTIDGIAYKNNNTSAPTLLLEKDGKEATARLLKKCQESLKKITGVDYSIHIKLFEQSNGDTESGTVKMDNKMTLKTYERVPSLYEAERIMDNKLRGRSNNEEFIVDNKWENEKQLYGKVKKYCNSQASTSKKNYAYDFVFGPRAHYWLSNDIKKDVKKESFFSNSTDYETYYNSLGIFIISKPLGAGGTAIKEDHKVIGLLIIDSHRRNVFHNIFIKELMGYFSHRFYDYFMNYNYFKSSAYQ